MSSTFWTVVATMTVILVISTILGRATGRMILGNLAPVARFYIAPALGLSILVVFVSLAGRHMPIGSLPVRAALLAMVVAAILTESNRLGALKHALTVSCFGLVCGAPLLGGLFLHGSYLIYNDTFTYLAHSIWLQGHSFGTPVAQNELTPVTSQIAMYQAYGLRMGASYLLALVQAIMGLSWSYEIYPAAVIAAVAACCLAAGFPLLRAMRGMSRTTRLALLALPAFALNGLTFGESFGFAPQTLGLAFASSLAFLIGYILWWSTRQRRSLSDVAAAAAPSALLFAALTYSYSEMMPFAVLGILASALAVIIFRRASARSVIEIGIAFSVEALVLLNTEVPRAIEAIRTQSNVVVGGPVNWSLTGFVAHALGVHGGAWDGFTWAMRGVPKTDAYFWGMSAMFVIIMALLLASKTIWRRISDYSLLPAAMIVAVLSVVMFYFRYGVTSPFPVGIGQSWSQFKLSEWASPFVSVFILLAVASLRKFVGRRLSAAILCLFLVGIAVESVMWPTQLRGAYGYVTQYFGAPRSVGKFLTDFRETAMSMCRPDAPIYLDLYGNDLKARETVALYLLDKPVHSDWRDDVYFNYYVGIGGKNEPLESGNCVIAKGDDPKYLGVGVVSGPFRIIGNFR